MAQRRMFSPQIVASEEFLTMPISSQALYFHLGMNADDDGFVQPKVIMRSIGSGDDDLKVLLTKRFLLSFETGVVVIKHWLIHNLIQKDRYHPTRFEEEKKALYIKENKAYTDSVNKMLPEVRLGKVSITTPEAVVESSSLQEISYEAEEDGISTKSLARRALIKAKGYDPKLTGELLKWGEEKTGRKYASPKKQMTAIAGMLSAGFPVEEIKGKWEELEESDWWNERGIDFTTVLSQINKFKTKSKPKYGSAYTT